MGTRTVKFYGQAYSDDGSPVSLEVTFDGKPVFNGTVPTYNLEPGAFGDTAQYEARTIELFNFELDLDVHSRGVACTIRPTGGELHVNTLGFLKISGVHYDLEVKLHSSHQKTDKYINGVGGVNDVPPNTGMPPDIVPEGATYSCVWHLPTPTPNHDFEGPEWVEV